MPSTPKRGRLDWHAIKDRIDLCRRWVENHLGDAPDVAGLIAALAGTTPAGTQQRALADLQAPRAISRKMRIGPLKTTGPG